VTHEWSVESRQVPPAPPVMVGRAASDRVTAWRGTCSCGWESQEYASEPIGAGFVCARGANWRHSPRNLAASEAMDHARKANR
jgi:hypothetical protein